MSKQNAMLVPLTKAFILAIGLLGAGLFVLFVCMAQIASWIPRSNIRQELSFREDGTPVIGTHRGGYASETTYRTLDNRPFEIPDNYPWLRAAGLTTSKKEKPSPWGIPWRQRVRTYRDEGHQDEVWYFVRDGKVNGHGWFAGYRMRDKTVIGYIGTDGYSPVPVPLDKQFACNGRRSPNARGGLIEQRFYDSFSKDRSVHDGDPGWPVYMISDHKMLEIDLEKHTVRTIVERDDLVSVGIAFVPASTNEPDEQRKVRRRNMLAVRRHGQTELIDPPPGVSTSLTIPASLRDIPLNLYIDDKQTAFVTYANYSENPIKHQIYWFGSDGKVSRHEEVKLNRSDRPFDNWIAVRVLIAITEVPLITTVFAVAMLPLTKFMPVEASSYTDALAKSIAMAWPELLFTYSVAALLAWIAYRRHRRYGLPRAWVWVVFVAVLGLPGMLAYLFHRTWPPIVPCPACEKPAARNRPDCSSCGEQFPSPTRKGIEVFA